MKEFTPEELAAMNGEDGRPVHVAHGGKVYDVSQSRLWKTGRHMNRHPSGTDLTAEIAAAPHGPEVFERVPQAGVLKAAPAPEDTRIPAPLRWLLKNIPMLRRHPHPMTVHFPIAFYMGAAGFTALHLATGNPLFDAAAFCLMGAAVVFTPVAIATGLFTWWLNYMAKPLRAVSVKRVLSFVVLVVGAMAFEWRFSTPDILTRFHAATVPYLALVFAVVPLVTVIGWFGASMTFPVEKE